MTRMPKKREILQRARDISAERATIHGLPTITPTEAELKESGAYHEARIDLMRREETGAFAQQERYMRDMAGEMGLVVFKKREHREQLRKIQAFDIFREKYPKRVKKVNGYKIVLPAIPQPKRVKPQPKKPRKPTPIIPKVELPKVSVRDIPVFHSVVQDVVKKPKKKRKRNHTQRTGKTMRKLRKVKGVKVFSFPDDVWKIKRKRRGKK